MASEKTLVYFGPGQAEPSELLLQFSEDHSLRLVTASTVEEVQSLLNRSFPACLVLDAAHEPDTALRLCTQVKGDTFTALVPVVIFSSSGGTALTAEALGVGADEVVTDAVPEREKRLRLELVLRRAARDVSAHPTTHLPGTVGIERDMIERLESGDPFAVCYADIDHFKEFNDRYGYHCGDKVILILSRILRHLVCGLSEGGFVGHIGGDDFIVNVPLEYLETCCDEIISLFDELMPYQYTEDDRRAGYFLGKDRRGSVHRVPLMTLSIGVVTNQFQSLTHPAQVSTLAAEMKSYAKSLTGSAYAVDRRKTSDRGRTEVAGREITAGERT